MSISLHKEILDRTTKCPHAFSCLDSGKCGEREMCEVNFAGGENVLFLKWKEASSCPYRMSFGYGQICTCPTHFAIVGRYNFPEFAKPKPNPNVK
jgi:hypothetical protein